MKKSILLAGTCLVVLSAIAASKFHPVKLHYKGFSLAFVHQPLAVEGKSLPFIDAALTAGSKERFGVYFGDVPATSPCIEILDAQGNVLQTLSVNDILGKGVSKEERILPNSKSTKPRRVETIYTVRFQQQDAQVIVKAIAAGDEDSPDQQLVVTFGLKTGSNTVAALRANLPILGTVESAGGGFVVSPKAANVALASSVFPHTVKLGVEKNRVVLTSEPKAMSGSREAALVWIVIKGVSSSSTTDARTQAIQVINDNKAQKDQPQLLIVNVADKEQLTYTDTTSYTVVCANIGAGEATNVVLGNPIPSGAKYVEGSATATGLVLNEEKKDMRVQGLKWTSSQPLGPGEERIVSFKVVLR